MTSLSLRHEFNDGQTIEFAPKLVQPLGIDEIRILAKDPTATVTLQCLADSRRINGSVIEGPAKVKQRITFSAPMTMYALVPNGGWLPLPFVSPQRFLLDRNVVANFRKLRLGQIVNDKSAHQLWTGFFEQGSAVFNPLPYAFEGNMRRLQTFDEFVQSYEQGASEIEQTFPQCRAVRLSPDHYRIAYEQFSLFHAKTESEIKFICDICPLLVDATADRKVRSIADRILMAADRFGVDRQTLVVMVALSCLYEDTGSTTPSIGRQIFKFKQSYTSADAYNAISGLRHIELAALGHAFVPQGQFALCTCDKAIASLWCALAIRNVVETATGPEYEFDISSDLLPRLIDQASIAEIAGLLRQ